MKKLLLAVSAIVLATPVLAGEDHQHHHHHDMAAGAEKLGTVSFPTSCSPASQKAMERGIALLHSFDYTKAAGQFEELTQSDSGCAMAHWGRAMTDYRELWNQPEPDDIKRGAEQMEKARAAAASATPREQAYIAALSAFYEGAADRPFRDRAVAYAAKMNDLHRDFPDDVEGAAFDALALIAAANPADDTLADQRKALAILVPLFATHPDHPGLAHYIIHTCDTPALAQDGLSAARQYASIAPSSPHALHMPGHIFARLGLWDEDIASNLASQTASKRAELAGMPGAGHQMHADEFLIYAWLQIGQDAKAKALTAKMAALGTHIQSMPGMDDMKNDGGFFDNELRAVLGMELRRWKSLAQEKPWPRSRPFETLFLYWGQGVAAGHLKDASLAAKALRKMDEGIDALRTSEFADIEQDALIKRDEVAGWLAYAQGRDDEAVSTLRAAADRQDKHGQMEVDIPAREMLGDLLLLLQRPDEALTEYRVALTLSPNRLNGLINAGRAAEKAGKMDESKAYFHQAADQAHTTVDLIRRRA